MSKAVSGCRPLDLCAPLCAPREGLERDPASLAAYLEEPALPEDYRKYVGRPPSLETPRVAPTLGTAPTSRRIPGTRGARETKREIYRDIITPEIFNKKEEVVKA